MFKPFCKSTTGAVTAIFSSFSALRSFAKDSLVTIKIPFGALTELKFLPPDQLVA
ncbi:hypothetical protein [Mucilaginibacter terrenus]|uniref:hypothetical protein n=1 Tax=Mucilaginibacter terrenus TaxID=2482727 RepID=UPI001403D1E5|nr:hypothetical protein [Mucilaginibacter terrenus]